MTIDFIPQGVCTSHIRLELDAGIICGVQFENGCDGNTQGISSLVKGMRAEEVIRRLKGIRCGFKSTSCPDQLARALEQALQTEETPPAAQTTETQEEN